MPRKHGVRAHACVLLEGEIDGGIRLEQTDGGATVRFSVGEERLSMYHDIAIAEQGRFAVSRGEPY